MIKNLIGAVKNWWILLIIGILSLICGIIILASPATGTVVFSVVLVVELIVSGVLGCIHVISNRNNIPAWGWSLVLPILSIILGIILACSPATSVVLVISLFAVGALFKAVEMIAYAISMSSIKGSGWGWTLAGGIILLLLSFYLFAHPLFTGFAVGYFVAFALLFIGIDSIVVSIQLSKIKSEAKKVEEALK